MLTLVPMLLSDPGSAGAQSEPITLTVRCRTVANEPIPGVAVTVIDAASDTPLANGVTDEHGIVRFAAMPPSEMLVRLEGTLPAGTALRHTRQDQRGIWVNLPARDWSMELRVDTDGLVFPDLGLGNAGAPDAEAATAIADGTLSTMYPTAPVATIVAGDTQTPRRLLPTSTLLPPGPASVQAMQGPAVLMLVVLLGSIGGVVWLMTRSRS